MTEEIREVVSGDGWAAAHIDALGDQYGFRKLRRELGVTAFGANALVFPPGYEAGRHYHERQEELYFVHAGVFEIDLGEDDTVRLGPGGAARVDARTIRRLRNVGEVDAVVVVVGGEGGYVGRDGALPEDEKSRFGADGPPDAA